MQIISIPLNAHPFVSQKLHLDVQMGEHSIDPNVDRTKDNLQTLESNLQHLISQMTYITSQQEYNRVGFMLFVYKNILY